MVNQDKEKKTKSFKNLVLVRRSAFDSASPAPASCLHLWRRHHHLSTLPSIRICIHHYKIVHKEQ